jgi:hypothetical protein
VRNCYVRIIAMLSDPQSVTLSGSGVSLPKTAATGTTGVYNTPDGSLQLSVQHTYGKRARHSVLLKSTVTVADPLIAGTNVIRNASAILTIDAPLSGIDNTALKDLLVALATWATSSSAANTIRLVGGES